MLSFKMDLIWVFSLVFLYLGVFSFGSSNNLSSRPAVVNIGALFTYDSTIGKVAKIAIEEAVKDVNSNFSILHGTKLVAKFQNTNCSGFIGMVEALQFMETDIVAIIGPQSSVVAHIVSHIANELQVPLLSFAATDPTLLTLQFPYFIKTTQSDLYQMTAVAQIVDHYGWREVIAIFADDDYGRNGISALDDKLAERRCKISYKLAIPPGPAANRSAIMDMLIKVFDAAIGDIAIVTSRTKMVDFTQPYAASGLVVVAPFKKLNSGAWTFLRPFTAHMWIVTAASFFVIGIVVWILEHRINDEFRGPPKKQLITILWFSLSTLFFAHRENTVSTLGRVVLLIWLFVVLIITSSYTASLTSILTVQQLSSPIKGMESLKNSGEPIGYQVGSFAEHYLSEELGISKSRLIPLASPLAYAQALQLGPKKGGVAAVVDERPYIELFLSTQCKFRIVGQEFTKGGWGFAFPRDSPLAVDISTAILQLSENGDLQRIHDKWLVQTTCSFESTEIESDQLQLRSFWGLFVICGIACFIALLVYFLQIANKLRRADPPQSVSTSPGVSQSGRVRRFLSLIDKKADQSGSGSKKRRVVRSLSDNDKDGKLGWTPKKKQAELTDMGDIRSSS